MRHFDDRQRECRVTIGLLKLIAVDVANFSVLEVCLTL